MINLWSLVVSYEGELSAATHLTEKGALIAAIEDMLMFLGIDDDPAAALDSLGIDKDNTPCYDFDALAKMNRKELSKLLRQWAEHTWDNDCGYQLEVIRTPVQP